MDIKKIFEAIFLGIVQGLTEFLPVSSSGHLLLLEKAGIGEEDLFFNICLHLGTLAAVCIVFRKKLRGLIKKPLQKTNGYILTASVPTVIIALVFYFFLPDALTGKWLPIGFMLTACLLFASEKLSPKTVKFLDAPRSLITGLVQGIAVLPGLSRSGSTISAMRFMGIGKEEAASFSFLLSIPIIAGSAILDGVRHPVSPSSDGTYIAALIAGMAASFICGMLAIKFFMKLISNRSMTGFSFYTLLAAVFSFFVIM